MLANLKSGARILSSNFRKSPTGFDDRLQGCLLTGLKMLTVLLLISVAQTTGARLVNAQERISPRVSGLVVDNNRHPVSKVRISLKGRVVGESAEDGSFSVVLPRSEPRIALTFAANGYVSNTQVFDSKATGINTIVVWPVAYRIKFDASRALDVARFLAH